MKTKDTRARNWTFIVYPESAPKDWRERLDELHVPWAHSPLHDKDVNPTGEVKKAHWHVLITFSGNKSYQQMLEITKMIKAPNPQKCVSAKGLIRYFCHLDNPEKYQYQTADIVSHGVDVQGLLELTRSELNQVLKEIFDFIDDNTIYSYRDLLQVVRSSGKDDWFDVCVNRNTLAIKEYLKSATWTDRNTLTKPSEGSKTACEGK